MRAGRYDVMVVGSGPAGSVAALVAARGGARVLLVDKAGFPRDKACGDLVGPRGVQTLTDLGIGLEGPRLGDMEVVGPTGRTVLLPAREGLTYPGHAVVAPRREFDALLRRAALDAGAEPLTGRVNGRPEVERPDGSIVTVDADVVIGADGALSRVGASAGLVRDDRVLWAFAVRGYLPGPSDRPRIHFWEPERGQGYPGYGWAFPGRPGHMNAGLGAAAPGDRRIGARPVRDLPRFLAAAGLEPAQLGPTLGGWLKLGMVGTVPAAGRTLLVGDAAGLVNSLQGEGIAQALGSGKAAAEAVLQAGPDGAAEAYKRELARLYGRYAAVTGPATSWMVARPRVVAAAGRLLTGPGVGAALAGGWALYWNDLLDGAPPGRARLVAAAADRVGQVVTAWSGAGRSIRANLATGVTPTAGAGTR